MNNTDWFNYIENNKLILIDFIGNFHPYYGNNYKFKITAQSAEKARLCVVENILKDEELTDPIDKFLSGIEQKDVSLVYSILDSTWFGVPETTSCWSISGFKEAVDLLENISVETYKIPSGEVTNLPLLKKIATTNKKVLLSSVMSSWSELDRAIDTLKSNGCSNLILLQCTSEYPCPPNESGLNVICVFSNELCKYPLLPS